METTETSDIPASVSQRLLWMIKHYRSDYGALNCPMVCRITGPLDTGALRHALDTLAARHDALRTTFQGRGARLTQRVHPPRGETIHYRDLSGHDDPASEAERALAAELRRPIDPQEWPLRATLWRVGPAGHLFCLNLHHLVTDAWSTGILLRDLCLLYDQATGGTSRLPEPGWSPRQFVEWQRSLLAGDRLKRHQDYWRRQLAGARLPRLTTPPSMVDTATVSPPSGTPTDAHGTPSATGGHQAIAGTASAGVPTAHEGAGACGPDGPHGSAGGNGMAGIISSTGPLQIAGGSTPNAGDSGQSRVDTVDLPEPVVAALRDLARREQTTLFTVLLALFHAQLYRETGQSDIAVASMFANRTRPEVRETVGLLAGMVLLRARVAERRSFTDLVRHCHTAVIGAFAYSELPFQLLPADLVDTRGGRADDVMFNVMTETQHLRAAGGVHFELVVPTGIGSRFPFELALVPVGESGMRAALFRAPDRLDAAGGARFLHGFAALAAAAADAPDADMAGLLTTGTHA